MRYYHCLNLLIFSVLFPLSAYADGQGVPINYDNLSFFEEPLATQVGSATLSTNILLDQSVQYNSRSNDDIYNTRALADFKVEWQLPTSAQIGLQYFASYDRLADNKDQDKYSDNLAFFVSDEWGTVAVGNVTGSVREKTRRKKGFGNADLAYDDFLGALDETGGYYSVRYNSYQVFVAADQEGRAEAGLSFQRPIGKRHYFASMRVRKGDASEDTSTTDLGETYGGAVVGQYIYASFLLDTQLGYEVVDLDGVNSTNDHVFGSIGTQYKYGAYRVSAEGSLGRYDGQDRRAFALGSHVDVARGASLNLGVNYDYINTHDNMTGIASMRYAF